MFFHIVFVSSYSSQLGFLISFLNHLNRISTIKKKQIIFIIQLPTKGDPQTKYSERQPILYIDKKCSLRTSVLG